MQRAASLAAKQVRAWCITKPTGLTPDTDPVERIPKLQELSDDMARISAKDNVSYLVYQFETAPTTQRIHIQAYVEFSARGVTLNGVKKLFGLDIHAEHARGTGEDNKRYCTKEDSRYLEGAEFGVHKQQGKRTDLDDAIADIVAGANIRDIAINHPKILVKYPSGVSTLMKAVQEPPQRHPVSIFYWTGISGAGKTHWINSLFSTQVRATKPWRRMYNVQYLGTGQVWMDGYTDQSVAVFDEFAGSIPRDFILALMDGQPTTSQWKGSSTPFRATVLVFLSNRAIENMYRNTDVYHDNAFHRRLDEFGIDCSDPQNRAWVEDNLDRIIQEHLWAKRVMEAERAQPNHLLLQPVEPLQLNDDNLDDVPIFGDGIDEAIMRGAHELIDLTNDTDDDDTSIASY